MINILNAKTENYLSNPFGPVSAGQISVGGRLAKIAVHSTLEDVIVLSNGKKKPNYKMIIDLDCIILTHEMRTWVRTTKRGDGFTLFFETCISCLSEKAWTLNFDLKGKHVK